MGTEMGVQNTYMEIAAEMDGISSGKNIGRDPLVTNANPASGLLLVTSVLLPGNASNTNAGSHGATGRWIAYYL